jgi:hypothetical protein
MLNQLLPPRLDNTYRGRKLALWLFGLVVLIRSIQSLMIIINGYSIARSADGIPLETYPAAAAQTILALFAILSLNRLLISLVCVVVLVRYRSAIPSMFVLLALGYLAGEIILRFIPIVRVGTPPGPIVNLVMFALMILGLALSLWRRNDEAQVS